MRWTFREIEDLAVYQVMLRAWGGYRDSPSLRMVFWLSYTTDRAFFFDLAVAFDAARIPGAPRIASSRLCVQ